ncbi:MULTISPECIES: type I DNA topoisomerase [unclassified Desulfovibrio]|uniref:type I DNA topoisomerase n=1 Tax=unclassified Desulfovibrio TaxID=2593640 RepID=UPI000F5E4C88|nr:MULTISPECIES: type I DNA topoisomerase [unclassified Desulfovibrio]RRD71932.1 type I DNA topoisomerase [Desulfovibrio sp. OH1209_COT-279]RRD88145.1 type I DNA topoisomerase [Desulfovibrio sp. OH1186_COT-070]
MCAKLLILESPGKVKKVQEILGPGWKVAASVGHVRDLPVKEMGVAAPDFKPQYIPTDRGKDVLSRLAGMVKNAEEVFLATDPDREGEAIAWHLQDALKLKNAKRVTYTEITEAAIRAALSAPRSIDMALVAAQEGRRVLDRFCGYMVSGPLSNATGEKLSAGRVQSPAVRLVVDREKEIKAFSSTTHYGAELTFENVDNITDGWKAALLVKPWLPDSAAGQEYLLDKSLAEKAAALRALDVLDCKESESRTAPPAPFTTSTLQQAASSSLKFNPKQTMQLAQRLYEQGAITYMRTDSPNLSQEAVHAIRAYCETKGWPLVETPRTWKSKEGAQEAHEAIRPTHVEIEDAGETADEKALYRLIRMRSLACQLEDAVYAVRTLQLGAEMDGKQALFEAKGRTLLSQGWKVLADQENGPDEGAEEGEKEPLNPVPAMKPGTKATALTGAVTTKKTKPAARFTEASLIRELEKRGIGRPSTYAAIIDTISSRKYVTTEKRFLVPTPLGEKIVSGLCGHFSFIEYDFTRTMEQSLDDIAEGKAEYGAVIASAHDQLSREVQEFAKTTGKVCEKCGKPMVHRVKKPGKDGKGGYDFWGCSGWPECKESSAA